MISIKRINRFAGFTLIETLLVLFVITLLIGLPSVLMERSQENILIGQFFGSFERHLLQTQQLAVTGSEDTMIHFAEADCLVFSSAYGKEALTIPTALEAVGPEKIVFKQRTGNNGKLSKYSFIWKKQGRRIDYQFQMGSGRYVKKISKL